MHILETTFHEELEVRAFKTAREAAEFALEMLGEDYKDSFFLGEDGELKQAESRCHDFAVEVYPSVRDAVAAHTHSMSDMMDLGDFLCALGKAVKDFLEEEA